MVSAALTPDWESRKRLPGSVGGSPVKEIRSPGT